MKPQGVLAGLSSFVLLAVLVPPHRAAAGTDSWITNSSGDFDSAANWSDGVPGSADTAVFRRGAAVSYTVTIRPPFLSTVGSATTDQLRVGSNTVSFAPALKTSDSYTVDNPALDEVGRAVIIGESNKDTAAVVNTTLDTFTAPAVTLGDVVGSHGTLTASAGTFNVTGSDSANDTFLIGSHGTGTLSVAGNALVHAQGTTIGYYAGSTGTANVSGVGATLRTDGYLEVGYRGTGSLNVWGGAQVIANSRSFIAANSGSAGTVWIDGLGSTFTSAADLEVGSGPSGGGGYGQMVISDSGHVSDSSAAVGSAMGAPTASVQVTDPGSVWTNGGLYIGWTGNGSLAITSGGQVTGPLQIASFPGVTGTVTVDGYGSLLSAPGLSASIEVGVQGTGVLTVTGGAQVSDAYGYLGRLAGSIGTATVDGAGSIWTNTNNLAVGYNAGSGTLNVTNGGNVSVGGALTVYALGQLQGDGTVTGNVTNAGLVAPGNTIGALTINGNYSQSAAGNLAIELGGTANFDRLAVSGSAALDGTFALSLSGGFVPALGDKFAVLTFLSESGDFASYTGLAIGGHLTLRHSFVGDGLILAARPTLDGDINLDGVVNGIDIATVSSHWLETSAAGDANGDGIVNGLDIALIGANWLMTDPGGGGSVAGVPEPSTMVMAALAVACCAAVRRSKPLQKMIAIR